MNIPHDATTEFMTLGRLSGYFNLGRDKLRGVLARMPGVVTVGTGKGVRYSLPVRQMPVGYWRDIGLLTSPENVKELHGMRNPYSAEPMRRG